MSKPNPDFQLGDPRLPARFWSKVAVADQRCWLWTSALSSGGYARFVIGSRTDGTRRTVDVYRWLFELVIGPVPAGLVLDHLCRQRRCVNPAHLEPVTARENILRGEGPAAVNTRRTTCQRGHEFTPENTLLSRRADRGSRVVRLCRICRTASYQRWGKAA
jgi:hypothetical protein